VHAPPIISALPLGFRALFFLYSLSIEMVAWLALVPAELTRALRARAGLAELTARLGRERPVMTGAGAVLIHAVSVGEMHAAAPLVAALAAKSRRVVLSTGTSAGLDAARRLASAHPAVDAVTYLPWDRLAVRGWLARTAPSAVVVMETELWPNFFRACADQRVPLFIANGRIRPGDVGKYRMARPIFRRVLAWATWIGVQSETERDRFIAIGAPAERVEVAGNLKFDAALSACDMPPLASGPGDRPVVVAGSTHDPEERWLLACARVLADEGRPIRLVLAPRDVSRSDQVAMLARSHRCRVRRWSEPAGAAWDVLVLDRYATLRAWYAVADLVVMGGTFAPVGGHNILEPAALARPILVGPHVEDIASLVQRFAEAGALVRVPGADPARAMADACRTLLDDRALARTIGERAGALCREGAGSAARHAGVIVDATAA
jgi:3-deoxy-D-manno-octulosonic-acid transferase